ncbi:peptide MFS transporter [Bizionia paragorgiae]|uniref:Proton-dependent oligopeptide transporter, POT family n=1 Tax=Bizionia paragorgiae TaxID=283786 RepID=A0A1H4AMD7_BIZPA|nr:peptide MFS transporter [Bizionia paragorgiae]SEA37063.1 proton-dependent oligopeptide transporter, POT family [Bizionia paragorgiae]
MATVDTSQHDEFFKSKVLGHPAGLFVLFFTEMWERFSFYGMRVLLINFLTMAVIGSNPGWEWTAENAGALFGTYAGLLYLTPILGGVIADKFTGYRWAVLIGCVIMTLGHASMAFETEFSLYMGLALLVIGTGFFKPNITSIISEMYTYLPEKKDGAYTIFYMGVNAGAFFGMMLCGYLAERVGWSWGFGLAGVFMLFGTLQFLLAKPLFGKIGAAPKRQTKEEKAAEVKDYKENKFTTLDKALIVVTSIIGLLYLINDPVSKIGGLNLLPEEFIFSKDTLSGPLVITLIGMALFLFLVIGRIVRYEKVVRDRMIAVIIFAFFTVLFFIPFEQAATSMVIFARDYTDRVLTGNAALIFNIVNTLLTVIPLMIITWVLYLLKKQSFSKIPGSNVVLALCFALVWGIVIWMLAQDFSTKSYDVQYQAVAVEQVVDGKTQVVYEPITEARPLKGGETTETQILSISSNNELAIGQPVGAHLELGKYQYLDEEKQSKLASDYASKGLKSQIVVGEVAQVKENEVEITVSWFSILNSFFIIAFASFFSRWWESKYNPSAAQKYGLGLFVMGIGFAVLAYGSSFIPQGAEAGVVRVSMIWLILAYLFHTIGELCLSPVGLSYVSKLVPARMIALMFGMWYLAIAIGNKIAASLGGMVTEIQEEYSLSTFFLIFTIIPVVAGLVITLLNPLLKKLMHGVR